MRVSGPPCNHSDSRVKRPAVDLRDMKSALGCFEDCLNCSDNTHFICLECLEAGFKRSWKYAHPRRIFESRHFNTKKTDDP